MAVLEEEVHSNDKVAPCTDFHNWLVPLSYDPVERLARDPSSEVALTDHKRVSCHTCAEGKQSKGRQLQNESGAHSPIDRIGGVICSDLKGLMTPRDRLGNRYMSNFGDHKSNYVRLVLATRIRLRRSSNTSWCFPEGVQWSDSSAEDGFGRRISEWRSVLQDHCVARQRSEANSPVSNMKAQRMHRTVMNMARCVVLRVNWRSVFGKMRCSTRPAYSTQRRPT